MKLQYRAKVRLSAILTGLLFSSPLVLAQTAPVATGSPQPADDKEVIILSPFTVTTEKDNGYQAGSTISATALSTPLKESSAVVGVLTKEFLDDIAANSIEQAGGWAPNVYFQDLAEMGAEASGNYNPVPIMRGLNTGSGLGRDYFISNAPMDAATMERVEQPRGPNASLYGAAPQSGMINVNSKKALLQRRISKLDLRATSDGSLRAALDENVGNDRIALRFNAMSERVDGWRNGDEQRNRLLLLSSTWQLGRSTTLRIEALWDHREGSFPPPVLLENVSKWDGTTVVTTPLTGNPAAATGVTRVSGTNDYFLFDSTSGYQSLLNWTGFGTTTGYNLATYPDAALNATQRPGITGAPVLESREFTFSSTKTPLAEKDTRLFGATLEHVFFGKLATQVAWNYTYTDVLKWQFNFNSFNRDINKLRPDGTTNPHFGEIYTDQTYRKDDIGQYQRNLRLLLSYPIKLGFMEQRIVLMGGTRSEARLQNRLQLVRTNGKSNLTNNATNRIWFRRYASDGNSDLPFLGTGSYAGVNIDLLPWNLNYSQTRTKYWQAALAGRYWDGKVTTTVGLRHDFVKTRSLENTSASTVDTDISTHYQWGDTSSSEPTSLTGGIVYFPVSWLGVFANYAEGYNIAGVRTDLFGNLWPAPKYKGTDLGLKIELLGGRISGTISHYTSKRTGVDQQSFSPQNNFGQLWLNAVNGYNSLATKATTAGDTALAAQYTAKAAAAQAEDDKIVGAAFDSRDLEANGWELDLTANLTKNWRSLVNFALPDTQQVNASPISKAYYEAHRAEWEAMLSDPANFNTGSTQTQLTAIQDGFRNQAEGASTVGTPDYTANFFTTYSFSSGRLKGLRAGGGIQFQGPRLLGVPAQFVATSATAGGFVTPDLLATIKSESTQIVSAMVSYDFKLWNKRTRLQLNVSNLLDEDKLINTDLSTYTVPVTPSTTSPIQGYQVANRFRYITPRTYTLTWSIDL